uniref:BED-type domain-containing protein n=1 Tax=Peronospora matthiolae TaxID=2874970 RepID=A0AAV1UQ62_9STRA
MGRGCSMDEWVHFTKLLDEGRVSNSSYWYVLCRHCVSAYEQKQLLTAPVKLTGRRSAMRSHLKSCPVYATQYESEQCTVQETAVPALDDRHTQVKTLETGGGTPGGRSMTTTSVGEKRKRRPAAVVGGRRGKHHLMEEWMHFTRLQTEGYIGNSNFFYAVCKHCERAHEAAADDQKPLLVPEKIVGRREKMRKHLSQCPHFKGELPPLGRRLYQRSTVKLSNGAECTKEVMAVHEETGSGVAATVQKLEVSATAIAGGITAATMTKVSSRQALNEWHFFTRLERKQDSAYYYARCNFCQQAFESAPESLKASMKPTIVMGRKSNMQTHLAKCPHMPKDALMIEEVYGNEHSTSSGSGATVAPVLDAQMSLEPKRTGADVGDVSLLPSSDTTLVHRALVQLLIEHQLPFEWIESHSARRLFRALVPTPGTADRIIPSAADLRTRVLENVYSTTLLSELSNLQELIPLSLGTSAPSNSAEEAVSVAPIGPWPASLHCNMVLVLQSGIPLVSAIDGVVTNGKAIVSLAFIRAQEEKADVESARVQKHGLDVARWLDEHIRLCVKTAKVALAVVVLPYNSIAQRAIGILRSPARWSNVTFLLDMENMLHFPLLTLLATSEMCTVVSSLIEVWQLESIRSCVIERLSKMDGSTNASPFSSWHSCAVLIEVLLDDKTFAASTKSGTANAQRLVENALNRSLLERVCNLLRVFSNVFSSCRAGLTLSEAMMRLGVLFTAAKGFPTVQRALEVVWEQMEQPLFVLAHALNPRLRLRDINSTVISKFSTLSDLSVLYFTSLFKRRPNSLRGEVTAYLHASQQVFTANFVAEFPIVDDYFRYLGDDYPSLSMLMQVLNSLSPVSLATRAAHSPPKAPEKDVSDRYTIDEQLKLDYLRGRWGITSGAPMYEAPGEETRSRIAAHDDRSGAAMLNAGVVMDEWKKVLTSRLHERGVDLSSSYDLFNGVNVSNISCGIAERGGSNGANGDQDVAQHSLKLPALERDDELTVQSTGLRSEFSTKVPLKDLFKSAESCVAD